ncbi:hypothetical protein DAI22_01g255650 [Oryza sativa Japonica Group]|nr:hypothetical protein DAI22_01g255650 [Oryza sativa Japonica Group]
MQNSTHIRYRAFCWVCYLLDAFFTSEDAVGCIACMPDVCLYVYVRVPMHTCLPECCVACPRSTAAPAVGAMGHGREPWDLKAVLDTSFFRAY